MLPPAHQAPKSFLKPPRLPGEYSVQLQHVRLIKHGIRLLLTVEKQLWLSVFLNDKSVAAKIWTEILTTRQSEHKSDALNRSVIARPILISVSKCTNVQAVGSMSLHTVNK